MDGPEVGIGRQKIESGGHFSTAARNGGGIFCLHLWPKSINRRGPAGLYVRKTKKRYHMVVNHLWPLSSHPVKDPPNFSQKLLWPKTKCFTIWPSASAAEVLFQIFGLQFFLKNVFFYSLKEDKQ